MSLDKWNDIDPKILDCIVWTTYPERSHGGQHVNIDVKHLCIRLREANDNALPNVPATLLIMKEFGIDSFDTCLVELNGSKTYVEIWEPQTKSPYPGGHFRQVE